MKNTSLSAVLSAVVRAFVYGFCVPCLRPCLEHWRGVCAWALVGVCVVAWFALLYFVLWLGYFAGLPM